MAPKKPRQYMSYDERQIARKALSDSIDAAAEAAGPFGSLVSVGGKLVEWGINSLYNDLDPRSRFKPGVSYRFVPSPYAWDDTPIPLDPNYLPPGYKPSTKTVQDPRFLELLADIKKSSIDNVYISNNPNNANNLNSPLLPIQPLEKPGFNSDNNDVRFAKPGIAYYKNNNNNRNPSSRPSFNAAMPSSSQGFYKPYV